MVTWTGRVVCVDVWEGEQTLPCVLHTGTMVTTVTNNTMVTNQGTVLVTRVITLSLQCQRMKPLVSTQTTLHGIFIKFMPCKILLGQLNLNVHYKVIYGKNPTEVGHGESCDYRHDVSSTDYMGGKDINSPTSCV